MNKDYKFLFLYRRLPDYFLRSVEYLVNHYSCHAVIICYESDPNAVYDFTKVPAGITIVSKSNTEWQTKHLNEAPDIIYVSGWGDRDYNKLLRRFRGRIPIVVGIDNPWKGTLRQILGAIVARYTFIRLFSHAWIAGFPQYEFARKLGFSECKILRGIYVANSKLGNNEFTSKKSLKQIVYVGRLVGYKRPDWLVRAFMELSTVDSEFRGWKLVILGSGPLLEKLQLEAAHSKQIEFIEFSPPESVSTLLRDSSIFCLPSHQEHWGVVVQEAALAALPMLLSDTCGAATEFLINGFNGYLFSSLDFSDFKKYLAKLMQMSNEEREIMGERSRKLGTRITNEQWSANLMSLLID